MPQLNTHSGGSVLLAQAGRDGLVNFNFVLEAPWTACRLCGSVYQSEMDRSAYLLAQKGLNEQAVKLNYEATQRRQRWLELHNKRKHPNYEYEVRQLHLSGMPVTAVAAGVLSTYGIIPISVTPYEDEVAQALAEAPRAPVNDAEGTSN